MNFSGDGLARAGSLKRASAVSFREIDASAAALAELSRFYRALYVREFPDADERESLANMKRYLALKAQGWYGKNNYHVVIAEVAGKPIGGCVFDFLAEPNAGVLEFLFITATQRGRGFGKALLQEATRLLRRDARVALGKPLSALVAEMNDPFRPNPSQDNLDPFDRSAMWGRWGFKKIHFPYVQPALSPRQKPVECLALITKRLHDAASSSCDGGWVLTAVREYMRWAMRIPQPARNRQYQEMARFLDSHARIPLIPLQSYVGRGAESGLLVQEVDAPGRLFNEVLRRLRQEIKTPDLIASDRSFRQALASRRRGHPAYHLWALRSAASARPEGMASFFTLRPAGFGGYIAMGAKLRGKGLLRALVARIEERMIRDSVGVNGWFIECASASLPAFLKIGFTEVPVQYRPPTIGSRKAPKTPIRLLYKSFGMAHARPRLEPRFVLDAIAAILKHVYGIRAPQAHPCYLQARESLGGSNRSGR